MEFYTAASEKRPVRLNDDIRKWAWESEHGKYGDEAKKNPAVEMDDIEGFEQLPPIKQYDSALRRIAERAPIRLCPHEKQAGAATLGNSIEHLVPARFAGEDLFGSISHHTPNFRRALTEGMESYEASVRVRMQDEGLTEKQRSFLESVQNVIECMKIWHSRYLEAAREKAPETYELLCQVPMKPARNFREAAQSLWFVFAFMRLCGNWPGIGRLDWLLGEYLEKDLKEGALTMDEAREILASLFIKGTEWIQSDTPRDSGDAQHYQNIVLGGTDEEGRVITNAVTYLVLDIVEELAISDFPITVRISENTPDRLMRRIAEVVRHGGGVVAVYNEELILKALEKAGYDPVMARRFANDGCWEVQLPGETSFGYMPFDSLRILNRALGVSAEGGIPEFAGMEAVYKAFIDELRKDMEAMHENIMSGYEQTAFGWEAKECTPCTLVSLFTDGCIEKAQAYQDLGPNYTVRSPHIGGAPDVGNSLYAIDKLVFEEKKMTFAELIRALRDNWEGREADRLYARSKYVYYGNDHDEADAWTTRVLNDFADIVNGLRSDVPVKFVPGVSTFGRQIEWSHQRAATAFGAKAGEILSGNGSPTPGTDFSGATAIIRSYCKADMTRQTTGAALDIKLYPDTVKGENGLEAIEALIRGFVALGGYFMQVDVMDAEILRAAQANPTAYKTLSVRVSGWNARFVTLDQEWQNMIIERTAQHA